MSKAQRCLGLCVVKGPREGDTLIVERSPFLVGRDQSADLFLDDPAVSRLHCALIYRDGEWILQDMGGRNLPLLHGRPALSVPLAVGDHLQLGTTQLRVGELGGPPPTLESEPVEIPAAEISAAPGQLSPGRATQLAGRSLWEVLETWTEVIRGIDESSALLEGILDGLESLHPNRGRSSVPEKGILPHEVKERHGIAGSLPAAVARAQGFAIGEGVGWLVAGCTGLGIAA